MTPRMSLQRDGGAPRQPEARPAHQPTCQRLHANDGSHTTQELLPHQVRTHAGL
jgi:hypothetical protein